MKQTKKTKILLLTLILLTVWTIGGKTPAYGAEAVKIVINNQIVPSDTSPVIIADRTYVPIRVVSENLGATVNWQEDRQQVVINWRTVFTANSELPPVKIGEVQIVIDGKLLVIPAGYGKPFINDQWRTMVPLRAVAEAMDCEVSWIGSTNTVVIKSKTLSPENQLLFDLSRYQTNLKLMDGSVVNTREFVGKDAKAYSTEQLELFKTYLSQLSKYPQTVTLPSGASINTSDISIIGNSYLTAAQLRQWIITKTPEISANMTRQGIAFKPIPDLADLYIKIGAQYGVRGDLAFCQAAKETGYWQFTGSVQPWQNNYCGLWATGSPLTGLESLNGADPKQVSFQAGVHGAIFASPAAGVEAHIQHLYAYATNKSLPTGKILVDPRFVLVNKGIAPTWLGLNARWAVPGTTYGQSIISDYWLKAMNNR